MSAVDPSPIIHKEKSWQMFNAISPRYDLLNRILSLGLDRTWRKALVQSIDPTIQGINVLDLATGTADVLLTLCGIHPKISSAVGLDLAEKMLDIGRVKIKSAGLDDKLKLQTGDMMAIPFEPESFDYITLSFGIRNVPDVSKALKEMVRVLKPKGQALILEFSKPTNPFLKIGYLFYLRVIVPLVGFLVSGHYRAYQYLNRTIEQFPSGMDFVAILKENGFVVVEQTKLLGGVATIYRGKKN